MGFSHSSLTSRFWASAYTRGDMGASAAQRHSQLLEDAARIPASDLVDAGPISSASAAIPMSRILLNAPEVHSRYVGEFRGAVVAEIAVFRLNNFAFSFDPVLQDKRVPVLPALKVDILKVVD